MLRRTQIRNAVLVNEGRCFRGTLVVEDQHIEEITDDPEAVSSIPCNELIDAEGCCLLPGIIDTHVHFREPGMTHKADMATESQAAAAGGVTSYFDMPNCLPPTTTPEAWREKCELASQKSIVNFAFLVGATEENVGKLREFDAHLVPAIKLFMGASTGGMCLADEGALRQLFETVRLPIVAHCEDQRTIAAAQLAVCEEQGADPELRFHSQIRPAEACYRAARQAVKLAREFGARLHLAHVSTAKELRLISPKNYPNITAEACLPHLLFCQDDYARYGAQIKCNPAVKTADDRKALREALTSGKIATIATDHAPHLLNEKQGGCLKAASGIPMVQFSLVAMLDMVDQGVLRLEDLVRLMCHAPAELFSIENRGFLREGYKADLVLVRPRSPWILTPNKILSRCGWSPLEGHTFGWKVEKTFCNGNLVYNRGHITDHDCHGQPLTFYRKTRRRG